MMELESKAAETATLKCNKSVYVYTAMSGLVMKVDIWKLEADKNRAGFDYMARRDYLGHFDVDLTFAEQTGRKTKVINQDEYKRYEHIEVAETEEVFQNEERSPSMNNSRIQERRKAHEVKVTYQVLNTHSLAHLHIFIPP
jgi:hypothetical protein